MFLQIHTLVSYPASLLNRDDAGLAKRIPFGDATRLRVSSQCQKRHWRESIIDIETSSSTIPGVEIEDGFRSRHIFERVRDLIAQQIKDAETSEQKAKEEASALTQAVFNLVISKAKKKEGDSKEAEGDAKEENENTLMSKQAIYLSKPEVEYLVSLAKKIQTIELDLSEAVKLSEPKKKNDKLAKEKDAFRAKLTDDANLEAMRKSARGLTSALFGRMITSDLLARVDAPIHVAHAMTVHAARSELDYFTVVDDLAAESETGGAHLGQTELGAGVYYGYVVVDVPLLVSNLTGSAQKAWKDQDGALPRRVLDALVRTIASQSPGAKLGSTAPYAYADLVLLETGVRQPRTLANAFLEAVPTRDGNISQRAAEQMADYLKRVDGMYGSVADRGRCIATVLDAKAYAPLAPVSLDTAIGCALDAIWD